MQEKWILPERWRQANAGTSGAQHQLCELEFYLSIFFSYHHRIDGVASASDSAGELQPKRKNEKRTYPITIIPACHCSHSSGGQDSAGVDLPY